MPPIPEPTVEVPTEAGVSEAQAALADAQLSIGDAPATVSVTESADGGLDVSVRVPGDDPEPSSGDATAESPLISGSAGADITSAGADEAGSTAEADSGLHAVPTSTNISVRVLSPEDDESADDDEDARAAGGRAGADESRADELEDAGSTAVPSGSEEPAEPAPSSEAPRYQDVNSQYQFSEVSDGFAWIWVWNLTRDCAGQVTSDSREIGSYASSEWVWDWVWNWGCEAAQSSDGAAPATSREQPARGADEEIATASVPVSDPSGTAPEPGVVDGESSPMWTWTFTFCGTTTTITTRLPADPLRAWAWRWAWTWTCSASAPEAPAPAPDDEPPAYSPPAPSPTVPAPTGDAAPSASWPTSPGPLSQPVPAAVSDVISALPFSPSIPLGPVDVTISVPFPGSVALPGDITLPVPFAPSAAPTITSPAVSPLSAPGTDHGAGGPLGLEPTTPASPHVAPAVVQDASPAEAAEPTRSAGELSVHTSHQPEANRVPRARPAPPRSHDPRAPRGRLTATLGGVGSSSASGGTAPSSSVLLVAVLTGFLVLAAPGIGRRIRVARGLSPRSPSGPPIDHPG